MVGEIREWVKPIRVDMVCPNCGGGRMRSTGTELLTYPPQYTHACTTCGYTKAYLVLYPYIEWEDIGDGEDLPK